MFQLDFLLGTWMNLQYNIMFVVRRCSSSKLHPHLCLRITANNLSPFISPSSPPPPPPHPPPHRLTGRKNNSFTSPPLHQLSTKQATLAGNVQMYRFCVSFFVCVSFFRVVDSWNSLLETRTDYLSFTSLALYPLSYPRSPVCCLLVTW